MAMKTSEIPTRQMAFAAAIATALGLAPAVAVFAGPTIDPAPAVTVAQDECESSGSTTDGYSLQCVPNMVPDFSDQLTESEVAEPGFNAVPGGERGGFGGGHGR